MAGISLLLDLLARKSSLSTQSVHSYGYFSAAVAASAAAASVYAGKPFPSRAIFGDGGFSIAYCDAAAPATWKDLPDFHSAPEKLVHKDTFKYETKEYPLELKPLFSAFKFKALAMTSLRSFLLFYLPLLEPRPSEEDDEDFLQDGPKERPVDLVTPLHNSMKQIIRETAVVTTRRVLERVAVQRVSRRMAWKLLKDASRSAKRKAGRGMPSVVFFYSVSRTTFRGHFLGVTASWLVQIIIEIYRCFIRNSNNDDQEIEMREKVRLFGKKIYGTTIKCGASLIFASIGAGIGALFHPSAGQWIGCALGDFAGPIVAIISFEKLQLAL